MEMEMTASAARGLSLRDLIVTTARRIIVVLETYLAPLLDLTVRIWLARVFFLSGLTKIQSWDSTLSLFENEYSVPFLPPELAAYMGTFTELFFPVLLVLGLGTRFAAGVLFVFNIIAVLSYPDLGEVGLKDHQYWGLLLLFPLLHGPGKIAIDHFIRRRFFR
jgi:putative oxidoreductase